MNRNTIIPVLFTVLILSSGILIFQTACDESENGTPEIPARTCEVKEDCNSNESCYDGICAVCKCLDMGGYCENKAVDCAENYFDWSTLECPGGREEKCCLPDSSCTAIGGICTDWDATCPEGYGVYGPMDCPDGRYDQCCVPVR